MIGDRGADLWWGFHVLLVPLGALDPAVAMRVAGAALTLLLGVTIAWVLRRHGVSHAAWWAAGALVAVPDVSFRLLMMRPHVLTLAAAVALLSVLVRGRWWQVLLLSALIAWVHLALSWMAPFLALAYALTSIPLTIALGPDPDDRSVPLGTAVAAAVGGSVIGFLLRPSAIASGGLLYVQLVQLFLQKALGQPVPVATEVVAIDVPALASAAGLFGVVWVGAAVVTGRAVVRGTLGRIGRERATLLLVSTVVSVAFLCVAVFMARRAMVQWTIFGMIALPLAWSAWRTDDHAPRARIRRGPAFALAGVLLVIHIGWFAGRHSDAVRRFGYDGRLLEESATFLATASDPGDVVFHARWDDFGPLLAHNRVDRYLGGMDPIFQLAHDPRTYWEYFHLSADLETERTCDAYPCVDGVVTDTHEALRDHFGARWVLVTPARNPRFTAYLRRDARYRMAFETTDEVVFEVLAAPGTR